MNVRDIQEGAAAFAAASDIWYRMRYGRPLAQDLHGVVIPWIDRVARDRLRDSVHLRAALMRLNRDRDRLLQDGRWVRLGEWVRGMDLAAYRHICAGYMKSV